MQQFYLGNSTITYPAPPLHPRKQEPVDPETRQVSEFDQLERRQDNMDI